VRVLFYGRLRDVIGTELNLSLPSGCSVSELRNRLVAEHPQAEQTLRNNRAKTCVGETLVHDDHVLDADATVEFLPPVSGG
jgi:molybdopterin synthase sulfur carrier subunit